MSAYALFFRDTQLAIKGDNPGASFGEVSKIVASMWDGLDPTQKEVRGELGFACLSVSLLVAWCPSKMDRVSLGWICFK